MIKRVLAIAGYLLLSSLSVSGQLVEQTRPVLGALPFQIGGPIPAYRFSTQAELLLGTATILLGDRPRASLTANVKGVYQLTGNIYVSTGLGLASLHSESRSLLPAEPGRDRAALVLSLPSGIGFTMGDDRAGFLCGVDMLPSWYLKTPEAVTDARKLAIGFAPEFGFLFKVGRRNQKGIQVGMLGRVHFLQPVSHSGGSLFRYAASGAGLIFRFN